MEMHLFGAVPTVAQKVQSLARSARQAPDSLRSSEWLPRSDPHLFRRLAPWEQALQVAACALGFAIRYYFAERMFGYAT